MRLRHVLIAIGVTSVVTAAAIATTTIFSGDSDGSPSANTLTIDFATYNPLSLIIKSQGWLEEALADEGVTVEWVQSAGSNKANEFLRSGAADVASTAGSAALLARANGSPIRTIAIYSQPEWSALVAPSGSGIEAVSDLAGRRVAATKGTDPYFFLLQALDEAGVPLDEVTVENLQHADGWAALQNGAVDAWAGLDPIMAGAEEAGATLVYRNLGFNSYGFLNATESFLAESPELAQQIVDAYAHARQWAADHPDETAQILAEVAGLDLAVATRVIEERSNLDADPVPGDEHRAVLERIGPIFVDSGDVASQDQIDQALDTLFEPQFVGRAAAERIAR